MLDDRQISRLHARVVWRDDHYEIEDLGSKNGTHLNGRDVVTPQALHDGDEIQIALRYKLAFVDAGATAPLSLDAPLPSAACGSMRPGTRCTSTASRSSRRSLPSSTGCWKSCWRRAGVVVRDDIVRAVWPDALDGGVSEQSIDALVRRLRERLAEVDPEHQYIVTMRGHGFRFENRAAPD